MSGMTAQDRRDRRDIRFFMSLMLLMWATGVAGLIWQLTRGAVVWESIAVFLVVLGVGFLSGVQGGNVMVARERRSGPTPGKGGWGRKKSGG